MLRGMKAKVTRLNYCQFLVSTQINYTLTYFAGHTTGFSHDAVNAYLERDEITPRLLWEQVKGDVVTSPQGFVLFDDTVADKNHSRQMDLVRHQYSGNAHGVAGQQPYQCVDELTWNQEEEEQGKLIHIKDFPKGHQVKLFRLLLSTERRDYVATNDLSQNNTSDTLAVCAQVGRLSSFTAKPSRSPELSNVNAAKRGLSAIILSVLCLCGDG